MRESHVHRQFLKNNLIIEDLLNLVLSLFTVSQLRNPQEKMAAQAHASVVRSVANVATGKTHSSTSNLIESNVCVLFPALSLSIAKRMALKPLFLLR
jgi:hypothetical protein